MLQHCLILNVNMIQKPFWNEFKLTNTHIHIPIVHVYTNLIRQKNGVQKLYKVVKFTDKNNEKKGLNIENMS